MYFQIQVSKDSPTSTINENFDNLVIPGDRVPDYPDILLSELIKQHLFEFNRKNIFSSESFSVYEDSSFYSCAMCAGDFYSYTFACYLFFTKSSEVVDFLNSFSSDPDIQFKLRSGLQDILDKFSFDSSFEISAVDLSDRIESLFCRL